MEVNTSLLGDDSIRKLDKIIFDYYYSLSSIAASKGNYAEASDYLSELLKSNEESTIIFDLQAKIAAQQGKFREAEFLWRKCLKTEPENPDYNAALNRINKILSTKTIRFYYFFKSSLVITVLVLIFVLLFMYSSERVAQKQQIINLKSQNEAILSKVENLITLKTPENKLLSSINEKLKPITGLTLVNTNNEIIILFDEGLFGNGADLKSNMKNILEILSKSISPYAGQIIVKIIGSTDSTPITFNNNFKNNDDLSIARAKAVFDWVYESSRIPREDMMIGSLGELNTWFPNDTPENRLKNRTVIIKISKKM